MKLLNPGPVTLTESVRSALAGADLCHREPEYSALQRRLADGIRRVYPAAQDRFEAVLLTGSGTAAVEAMVGSLVPTTGKALVLANGVYGERIADMLAMQGKHREVMSHSWDAGIDFDQLSVKLGQDDTISHVICVHHETTSGRLNDLARTGRICKQHGKALLVDAVSSFGAEAIDFEAWGIEAVAATANKCLHGAPGVSFVLASRTALQRPSASRSVYLDLRRHHEAQQAGSVAFTPAVHVCLALEAALREFFEQGGVEARHRRYAGHMRRLYDGLGARGCFPLIDPVGDRSVVLSAFRLPEGLTYERLHVHLKAEGFVIYAGQGRFGERFFRVSLMGDLAGGDVDRLLQAFDSILSLQA